MRIINVKQPLNEADIAEAERELGFPLPPCVRDHYLRWNGGQPEPNFYGEPAYTSVHDVLPLTGKGDDGSAVKSYHVLVVDKRLMPPRWLPFAVDEGGDYFFVDCSKRHGDVIYFRGDYWFDEKDRCVVDLKVTFAEFWTKLQDK